MRFMMVMIPDVYQKPIDPNFRPRAEDIERMGKYNVELHKAGVCLALEGLHPPGTGVRVAFDAAGKPKVTDGPFAEAKEVIGGFWLIDVKSREEAVEWARRIPAQPGDVIEVRQIFDATDFGPKEREAIDNIRRE
jgi:hypothetical protein